MKFKDLEQDEHFKVGDTTWIKIGGSHSNAKQLNGDIGYFSPENEVIRLRPYKVSCEWAKSHLITVYAECLEDAIDIVNEDDGTLINTDTDGDYVDDSFWVNEEVTMELNNEES